MTTKITDVQHDDGLGVAGAASDLSAVAEQLAAASRRQGVKLTGPGG